METELKIKLEDIVLLGESITKLTPEVYGLHRKIVNGQEPKIPTKEQIDYIRKQMDLLSTPLEDIPVIAIEIWEKIRNQQ